MGRAAPHASPGLRLICYIGGVRIANLGPGERRKRRVFGLAGLVISVALALALLLGHAAQPWRLALFAPLFAAALGFFQDRDRT